MANNSFSMLNSLLQRAITADLNKMKAAQKPVVKEQPKIPEKTAERWTEEPLTVTKKAAVPVEKNILELRKAVVMAEVLKEPVAYRRHRKRKSVRMV